MTVSPACRPRGPESHPGGDEQDPMPRGGFREPPQHPSVFPSPVRGRQSQVWAPTPPVPSSDEVGFRTQPRRADRRPEPLPSSRAPCSSRTNPGRNRGASGSRRFHGESERISSSSRYVIIASRGIITASKSETEGERICVARLSSSRRCGQSPDEHLSPPRRTGYRIVILFRTSGRKPPARGAVPGSRDRNPARADGGCRPNRPQSPEILETPAFPRNQEQAETSECFEQVKGNHRMVMERHINPTYMSNLAKRVQRDHQREPSFTHLGLSPRPSPLSTR